MALSGDDALNKLVGFPSDSVVHADGIRLLPSADSKGGVDLKQGLAELGEQPQHSLHPVHCPDGQAAPTVRSQEWQLDLY